MASDDEAISGRSADEAAMRDFLRDRPVAGGKMQLMTDGMTWVPAGFPVIEALTAKVEELRGVIGRAAAELDRAPPFDDLVGLADGLRDKMDWPRSAALVRAAAEFIKRARVLLAEAEADPEGPGTPEGREGEGG